MSRDTYTRTDLSGLDSYLTREPPEQPDDAPDHVDDAEAASNLHHPVKPAFYTVCPFIVDRAYGGPEEGGWWYTHGEPVEGDYLPIPRITRDEDEAGAWREIMQAELDAGVNQGRRDIGSVLSEGVYRAEVCEGWPQPYPAEKPHYE